MTTKLEQAAREVVRQHSMECLSDKAIDALREALAEPMTDTELINANCRYTTPLMAEQAEQEPVLCVECGKPTMHIGNKCYACCQKDTKDLEDALKSWDAAPVQQAEQEPEVWYCPDCGTLSETQVKCCPDWIRSRKVTKNFAITCKATFDRNGQAEQEPVAWGQIDQVGTIVRCVPYATTQYDKYKSMGFVVPLYAAPVRTKDLTDDEIVEALGYDKSYRLKRWVLDDARAVIAADREKNK